MNVLYITVDALRADHVNPEVMPFTHEFVADSIEYTRCYANGPGTPWSFPSLLGGRYAGGADGFGIPDETDPRPTLAEILQDDGYATAGFTDNRFASSDYNYDRGIEMMWDGNATSSEKRLKQAVRTRLDQDGLLYHTLLRAYHLVDDMLVNVRGNETRFARAETLVDQFLDWRKNQDSDWFGWVHPMDAHAPYEAPEEYQQQYLNESVPRRKSQKLASAATHHPEELSDAEWQLQQKLYNAECRYLDDQIKRLLQSLSKTEKENTIIVFTADHGEMHGEHGLGGHPQQFWEEVLHVPCAIAAPDLSSETIDRQVALVDLPPTILDAAGSQIPENWDGYSILPTDNDPFEREHVFVDVEPDLNRNHAGVRHATNWKLMRHDDNGELLLDLNTNPDENPSEEKSTDATDQYQKLTTALENHLDEMERRRQGEVTGIEDKEMIEDHLKELGYLE
jgi:arylsulfatase A-like enzyme